MGHPAGEGLRGGGTLHRHGANRPRAAKCQTRGKGSASTTGCYEPSRRPAATRMTFEDPVDWDAIDEKFEGIMAGSKVQETQRSGRPPPPRPSRWASTRGWSSARNSSTTRATGATRRSCPTLRSARACSRRSTARSRSRAPSTSSRSRGIEAVTRRATGPIPPRGRPSPSQNARRHGLNATRRKSIW